jgi:hypothetical protein
LILVMVKPFDRKMFFSNHCLFNANLTEGFLFENDKKLIKRLPWLYLKRGQYIVAYFEEPLYETVNTLSVQHNRGVSTNCNQFLKLTNIRNAPDKFKLRKWSL